jgi:hypothetical protein
MLTYSMRMPMVLKSAFVFLFSLTLLALFSTAFDETYPFPHWLWLKMENKIDRSKAGYNQLPEYVESDNGGYFEPYASEYHTTGPVGRYTYDTAFWPDGDPGHGTGNPLPPLIIRHEIYAIQPALTAFMICSFWIIWIVLSAIAFRSHLSATRSRGFQIVQDEERE